MKENEFFVGIENFSNFHTLFNYKLNKHIQLQFNLEFSPLSILNKKSRGFINKVGIGLQLSSFTPEDMFEQEEDFSDFNYDKYLG